MSSKNSNSTTNTLTINTKSIDKDINPFPPYTNAHLNYFIGMGFPPISSAPYLWGLCNKIPPKNVINKWPLFFKNYC